MHEIEYNRSSLEACIRSAVTSPGSEGDAVYNSIIARDEILKNSGGIDIYESGYEYVNLMNKYENYVKEGNKKDAINKIGASYLNLHPSTASNLTYRQFYENYCKTKVR